MFFADGTPSRFSFAGYAQPSSEQLSRHPDCTPLSDAQSISVLCLSAAMRRLRLLSLSSYLARLIARAA
jgi:hypothetical protein